MSHSSRNPIYAPRVKPSSRRAWGEYARQGRALLQVNGVDTGKPVLLVEVEPSTRQVVAALAADVKRTSNSGRTIEFDVAVDRDCRGKGLGRLLVDELLGYATEMAADYDVTVRADAVNPLMEDMLRRRGFYYDGVRYTRYM